MSICTDCRGDQPIVEILATAYITLILMGGGDIELTKMPLCHVKPRKHWMKLFHWTYVLHVCFVCSQIPVRR